MPWEVSFRREDGQQLGEVSLVCSGIEAALPETRIYREWSGREKLEAATAQGVEFPEVIRAAFEHQPAKIQAYYQEDDLIIVFYGFESEPLRQLHAEIRGNGNPAEALLRICDQNAWQAIDDSTGETINLRDPMPAGWQSFVKYRERTSDPNAGETA